MENRKENNDISEKEGAEGKNKKGKKRNVKVINAPKRRKPLRTPTHIIRLCMVWAFIINILVLTYPFLYAQLYISEDLEVTPDTSKVHMKLATQDEIDAAENELKAAYDGLVKLPPEKEESTVSQASDESKTEDVSEQSQEEQPKEIGIRSLSTARYNWSYNVSSSVNIDSIMELIDKSMELDRSLYTEESVEVLNNATLKAQYVLCANVIISQNAWQMMIGGPVREAFGVTSSVGDTILHSVLSIALAVLPVIGFFAATFDKHRHIKHIIIMICCILALLDLFFAIYPYIGMGAVISIIMYVIISLLNFFSIYAKQQEDFIITHPENEAEFTEKHPQFVKALLNEKAFGRIFSHSDRKEKELQSAKNAQKRNTKKKKSK